MEEIHVSNYEEAFKIITKRYFLYPRSTWVFRGQSNESYSLIPKVGRSNHHHKSRKNFEKALFYNFRRESYPYVKRLPTSDWEWLTLAQHHGLPTRLLDWSYNPMVALFFCVASNSGSDGAVYALKAPNRIPDDEIEKDKPFDYPGVGKFKPNHVTERLIIQEGLFTIHADLELSLEKTLPEGWILEKLVIPQESKEQIRYLLYRQGIQEASLFPGLDGLAQHITWKHSVTPNNDTFICDEIDN